MEAPANPLMFALQSTPQTGGLVSPINPQAIELEGQNQFLAALQLMLGEPPPPAPPPLNTTPLLAENQTEPALEEATLPAIIAAQVAGDRQIIAGETPLPRPNELLAGVAMRQGAKPMAAPSVAAPSIENGAAVEEILPVTVEPKQDSPSANSLRLLNTVPVAANADLPAASLDVVTRELSPGQVINLTSSSLSTGTGETQMVRTSVSVPIPQAPGQAGWDNALGQRILWMTGQQIKEATIQLNPPELGQIQVRVSVDGDQTSVNFISQHANVREAIDSALPRLREMLGADGLNLADASVDDERQASTDRHSAERPDNGWATEDDNPPSVAETLTAQEGIVTRGLVDTYV